MDLELLGLAGNEQKVFEMLIQTGKSSAAEVSRFSGVSYGIIYNVLASLEQKGLVKVIPEQTKLFVAESPDKLIEVLEKKKTEFLSLERDLQKLKETYVEQKEAVVISKGERNFWKVLRDLAPVENTSYSIKYNFSRKPGNIGDARRLIKNKINYKTLGRVDAETKENFEYWKTISPNIKAIQNKGVAISVNDRRECLINLIHSNTSIVIKDEAFCDVLATLFESYYESN